MAQMTDKEYVSVAGVASALGVAADTRARQVGYLCGNAHGLINMWARGKPVRYPSTMPLSDGQRSKADQGLVPPDGGQAGTPVSGEWMEKVWRCAPPRGGADEPYRLSDFLHYDPDARPPVSTPGTQYISPLDSGSALRFSFGASLSSIAGTGDLTLGDFDYLKNYYPCVALNFGDGFVRCITGTRRFGEAGPSLVNLPVSALLGFAAGEFEYFMCGCSVCQTALGVPPSAAYVVLPSERPLRDRIVVSSGRVLDVYFERVTPGILGSALMFRGEPVSDYNPAGGIVPDPGTGPGGPMPAYRYLNVGGTYGRSTASFSMRVTNPNMKAVSIPASALKASVSGNLAGKTTIPAPVPALKRFKGEGSVMESAGSISLGPGESARYAVSWPENCCIMDERNHTVQLGDTRRFNAGFSLLYNSGSTTVRLGSVGINISNYDV